MPSIENLLTRNKSLAKKLWSDNQIESSKHSVDSTMIEMMVKIVSKYKSMVIV